MRVDHNIAPGAISDIGLFGPGGSTGPAFAGFQHRRDTDLQAVFLAVQAGLRCGDTLLATFYIDTNLARRTKFTQTTAASSGEGVFLGARPFPFGRETLAVLYLPDNTEGVITLDIPNRMWNWDLSFAFPMWPGLEFLAGWKYGKIRSSLDPYSFVVAPGAFQKLVGITNWENLFTNVDGVTSTTGFTISQNMLYHGPFIGARLSGGRFQALPAQWYVEGKIVPFAFGSYRFSWAGSYNDNDPIFGPGFLNGKQTTNAKGLKRYALEVKGGTHVDLLNRAFLDVWAKELGTCT